MDLTKYHTTIGDVFDYIVSMRHRHRQFASFPDVLATMQANHRLSTETANYLPFSLAASREGFISAIRSFPVDVSTLLSQNPFASSAQATKEPNIFPDNKDIFFLLNMPYLAEAPHSHSFFEITYVLQGSCKFLFEGESVSLAEGDVCIVSPESRHNLPLEPTCIAVSILVRKTTFDSTFGSLLSQQDLLGLFFRNSLYSKQKANYLLLKTGMNQSIFITCQQLVYECSLEDHYSALCEANLLSLFLAQAMRSAQKEVALHDYEGYSGRGIDFAVILQYIQQNYASVTLAALAKAFHFSEAYLSKLIRQNLNQNFTEVLRTLKMTHALEYLTTSNMKVSEIAEAVGYGSVDHFSRTFSQYYGLPPLKYQLLHSGK